MGAGRPSKYQPEYAEQVEKLCLLGATDDQIADFFGIATSTLYKWKHEHPEFSEALKAGKEEADKRVERSLYQRAVGFEQDEVKIFLDSKKSQPVYAPYRAKHAPDVTACIFWLKNRKSDEWRDKQSHEHTGKDGGPVQVSAADEILRALDAVAERKKD